MFYLMFYSTIYKYLYLLSLLPTLPAAALAKLTPPVGSVFFAEVGAGNPGKLDVGRETKRRGESADSVLISDTPPDDLFLFLKSILHTTKTHTTLPIRCCFFVVIFFLFWRHRMMFYFVLVNFRSCHRHRTSICSTFFI